MRKFVLEVLVLLGTVLAAMVFFGDIWKDLRWFYTIVIIIGAFLAVWIGCALTRAMNPKIKDKNGVSKVE